MPRPLRGIFRKRRKLLTLLFREAIACLRDWFRLRLALPEGELAAVAGVQSFGDYLVFRNYSGPHNKKIQDFSGLTWRCGFLFEHVRVPSLSGPNR